MSKANRPPVLVAGGGIGGLSVALTLQQIGVPCVVLEAVAKLKPLGVGINLQPNAVRELYELGIGPERLDAIGVQTKEWALVGLNGNDVYSEPRGLLAGYRWPQYAVHRGQLQMLLLERRSSASAQTPSAPARESPAIATTPRASRRSFRPATANEWRSRVAADRRRRPALGRSRADAPRPAADPMGRRHHVARHDARLPIRTGASFVGLGTHRHRVVFYPISPPDPGTGLATINWIAEITVDNSEGLRDGDWNKGVEIDSFIHHFTTGTTTGSTSRRCCAARRKCSNIR